MQTTGFKQGGGACRQFDLFDLAHPHHPFIMDVSVQLDHIGHG
jgi:hypothetical protein